MDLELLGAPAQVDLMAREGGEIDPGMTRQGRRDDKLRAELLGHRLQSAGCVHGIADGGERSRPAVAHLADDDRSEEHTSELQSLMRTSYAVFCLKKTKSI